MEQTAAGQQKVSSNSAAEQLQDPALKRRMAGEQGAKPLTERGGRDGTAADQQVSSFLQHDQVQAETVPGTMPSATHAEK